jgi:leucine-rich repeat protein SHOC2
MRNSIIITQSVLFLFGMSWNAFSQEDSTGNQSFLKDMQAVVAIINSNDITGMEPEDIIKTENGRIVGLYLKNDNYKKPLIKNIPADIGKLSALRELTLSRNFLKALPQEIGSLTDLRVLKLGENNLKDLPESLKNLRKLEVLDLRYNKFTVLPEVCLSMKSLRKLQLWGNKLETLPEGFCSLDSLRELYLQRNLIRTLPECMIQLRSLVYIDLNFNKLCNVSPPLRQWLEKWDSRYRSAQYCR